VTWDGLALLTGISIPVSPLEPCQERAQRHQIFCVARVSDSRVQAQQLRQLRVEPWFNPFLIVPDRSRSFESACCRTDVPTPFWSYPMIGRQVRVAMSELFEADQPGKTAR
jgi:hypothetical protein